MIISDLNHVEVVSEETETSIEGGYYGGWPYYYGSNNYAYAGAGAYAYGSATSTSTGTYTSTGPYSSSSSSNSSSSTYGGYYW